MRALETYKKYQATGGVMPEIVGKSHVLCWTSTMVNPGSQRPRNRLRASRGHSLVHTTPPRHAQRGRPAIRTAPTIPPSINEWTKLQAADFLVDGLGVALVPLRGIHDERAERPGKQPLLKDYRKLGPADCDADFRARYWSRGSNYNVGVLIREPFLWLDFDAKQDEGASAREWLEDHPGLKGYPRVGTRNGFHLPVIVRDLPPAGKWLKSHQVNDRLVIELLGPGNPVTVPPSLRLDGVPYTWEVTGDIPEFPWSTLCAALGIQTGRGRTAKPPGRRPAASPPFKGDLATLDLQGILRDQGLLGECLDEDQGKWSVICPWHHEHSGCKDGADSGTVVFVPAGRVPAFKCQHAHCAERGILDLCRWLDGRNPGVIDAGCTDRRAYDPDETETGDGLPLVRHPGPGRLLSETAAELGSIIGPNEKWFARNGLIMELVREKLDGAFRFSEVAAIGACAGVEMFVVPVTQPGKGGEGDGELVPKSFDRETMGKLLAAPQFRECLPRIQRILNVPLAVMGKDGWLVDLGPGYNPELELFVDGDAGGIPDVGTDEAKGVIADLLSEFCFETDQDRVHAIARLITPYVRPIMGWTARAPLWLFLANRPRAGKDYLAMLALLIHGGEASEDAPLERGSEETRKRITAALMSGRRFMHFANCQGHVDDAVLTGAITSRVFAARRLGGSDASDDLSLPNEIEFSMSANVGITFREDIGPRTRRISLAYYDEDPNLRRFRHTDLHGEVRKHRGRILGALRALVREWTAQECPEGPTPFTSFPEWSRVVGGIMHANGLGDPCLPHATELALGGDLKEKAMRVVFAMGFDKWPGAWVAKDALFKLLAATDDEDLGFFGSWTGDDLKPTRKKVGMALGQYRNRVLSGVRLEIDQAGKGGQQKVRFSEIDGDPAPPTGNLGNNGITNTYSGSKLIPPTVMKEKSFGSQYAAADSVSNDSGVSISPVLVTDPCAFQAIASQIALVGIVALDIETFGVKNKDALDPRRGRIRLLQLAVPGHPPWVIDMQATGHDLGVLRHVLEPSILIVHNARFDLGFLREACGLRAGRVFCTMTASKLLTNGTREPNDLFAVLDRHLGVAAYEDHSRSDWGAAELEPAQLRYAASDVAHLHALKDALELELEANALTEVADLEMKLIPVVVEIEAAGLPLDLAELETHRAKASDDAEQARTSLCGIAGNPGLNPNSPQQVKDALAALGLDLPDTSAETLAPVADHPFVTDLLKFRRRSKLATMLRDLAAQRGVDGRVHANFKPLGTETGRFSSSDPNLQNIPRGDIRGMVRPPQGMVFVKADYSQIDLRAAAALAGEQEMLRAFREGQDLHRLTASRVTGKPLDQITRDERQEAKAVNFGFIYAQGAEGFRKKARADYGLDLTSERAAELRQSFFDAYPAFSEWHRETRYDADSGLGEIRTRTGRRRILPPELTNWDRYARAVNTPVQGVAAEGMKMALVELHRRLPEGARIILTVHDDVLVECPTAIGEDVKRIVEEVMRTEMGRLLPEVPIEADAEVLDRWK